MYLEINQILLFCVPGFSDCVRCYHCGMGLRHWEAEDEPWVEHARWAPRCYYLIQIKGDNFIQMVQLAMQQAQNVSRF
jgi:baculoviral IAP repeat-containing protein 2/3